MRNAVTMGLAWLAATAVSVLAASAAVQVVARQVSEDLPPPVPAEYLQSPSPDPAVVMVEPSPSPGPTATIDPVATDSPVAPQTPPSAAVDDPSPAETVPEAATAPLVETRTVQTIGGAAGLRFQGGAVSVLWATPNSEYTASVDASQEGQLTVTFASDDHRSRIRAMTDGRGRPDITVQETGQSGEDDEHDD